MPSLRHYYPSMPISEFLVSSNSNSQDGIESIHLPAIRAPTRWASETTMISRKLAQALRPSHVQPVIARNSSMIGCSFLIDYTISTLLYTIILVHHRVLCRHLLVEGCCLPAVASLIDYTLYLVLCLGRFKKSKRTDTKKLVIIFSYRLLPSGMLLSRCGITKRSSTNCERMD